MAYKLPNVPLAPDILAAVQDWTNSQSSRLFCFILQDPKSEIGRPLVHYHICRKKITPVENIDVVLDSTGGDLEAAYKLALYLRRRCRRLRIFVPDLAKSAATFVTLAADEVWMTDTAELGPIDAQIPDPRQPDTLMSALDEFGAIDYLRQYGYQMMDETARLLTQRTRMNIDNILGRAVDYATKMLEPLYAQVDPLNFGLADRALKMSSDYGFRIMSRYAYAGYSPNKIKDILKALTWDYPSHSFVIDYIEAGKLGLKIKLLDGKLADHARTIVDGVTDYVGFIDDELKKASVSKVRQKAGRRRNKGKARRPQVTPAAKRLLAGANAPGNGGVPAGG